MTVHFAPIQLALERYLGNEWPLADCNESAEPEATVLVGNKSTAGPLKGA